MVDFKSKIKAQKAKDRKRAGKRSKSVSGDKLPSPPRASLPSARKRANNSAAIMKSVASLFKDNDSYSSYEPGDWGSDTDLGNFEDASWFGDSGGFDYDLTNIGLKKGGRLKNAGKRKRAALRGQRSELRGS